MSLGLETDRLRLSPMAESDLDDLVALRTDPFFLNLVFTAPPTTENLWFRVLRDIGHWQARGYGVWAARLRTGGDFVGTVGVLDYKRAINPALDAPEIGWGLASRFQGQGLAQEAVRGVLDWCDGALQAPRTQCIISHDNAPSRRLAQRLGYRVLHDTTFRGHPSLILERPRP